MLAISRCFDHDKFKSKVQRMTLTLWKLLDNFYVIFYNIKLKFFHSNLLQMKINLTCLLVYFCLIFHPLNVLKKAICITFFCRTNTQWLKTCMLRLVKCFDYEIIKYHQIIRRNWAFHIKGVKCILCGKI